MRGHLCKRARTVQDRVSVKLPCVFPENRPNAYARTHPEYPREGHTGERHQAAGDRGGHGTYYLFFKLAFSFEIIAHPHTILRNRTEERRALEPMSPMETPCKPGLDIDTAHQSCQIPPVRACVCMCDSLGLRYGARSHVHPHSPATEPSRSPLTRTPSRGPTSTCHSSEGQGFNIGIWGDTDLWSLALEYGQTR